MLKYLKGKMDNSICTIETENRHANHTVANYSKQLLIQFKNHQFIYLLLFYLCILRELIVDCNRILYDIQKLVFLFDFICGHSDLHTPDPHLPPPQATVVNLALRIAAQTWPGKGCGPKIIRTQSHGHKSRSGCKMDPRQQHFGPRLTDGC